MSCVLCIRFEAENVNFAPALEVQGLSLYGVVATALNLCEKLHIAAEFAGAGMGLTHCAIQGALTMNNPIHGNAGLTVQYHRVGYLAGYWLIQLTGDKAQYDTPDFYTRLCQTLSGFRLCGGSLHPVTRQDLQILETPEAVVQATPFSETVHFLTDALQGHPENEPVDFLTLLQDKATYPALVGYRTVTAIPDETIWTRPQTRPEVPGILYVSPVIGAYRLVTRWNHDNEPLIWRFTRPENLYIVEAF